MKTRRFIVGIVTTLLCAIAMFAVVAAVDEKPQLHAVVEKDVEIDEVALTPGEKFACDFMTKALDGGGGGGPIGAVASRSTSKSTPLADLLAKLFGKK